MQTAYPRHHGANRCQSHRCRGSDFIASGQAVRQPVALARDRSLRRRHGRLARDGDRAQGASCGGDNGRLPPTAAFFVRLIPGVFLRIINDYPAKPTRQRQGRRADRRTDSGTNSMTSVSSAGARCRNPAILRGGAVPTPACAGLRTNGQLRCAYAWLRSVTSSPGRARIKPRARGLTGRWLPSLSQNVRRGARLRPTCRSH